MILSDGEIIEYLHTGRLKAEPLEPIQIQPASLDIRLGDTFCAIEGCRDDIIRVNEPVRHKVFTGERYMLQPGQFVLATTMEYIKLPNDLTAFVEGRSSLGRLGLFIQNAGWVDPGFEGEITLELFNASGFAIELCPGTRIGQLVFAKMEREAIHPYRGKYQNQRGATGSRMHMDFEGRKENADH